MNLNFVFLAYAYLYRYFSYTRAPEIVGRALGTFTSRNDLALRIIDQETLDTYIILLFTTSTWTPLVPT